RVDQMNRLEHAGDGNAGEIAGEDGLFPAGRHEAHGGQVVDFLGPSFTEDFDQGELVEQIGLVEVDSTRQVSDALEILGAGAADNAVHLVTLLQQPIRQVAAVLAGDAGNECSFHAS